jgi:tetratricopeptide (TPR) repeat protein
MWKIVACVVLAAAIAAVPPAARAEPSATDVKLAEDLAQQAFDAHARGDFAGAIALYKRAYQTSPSGVILFNIANIYDKKLKDKEQALEYYRRYLRSGDSEPELVKRASERIDIVRAELDAAKQAPPDDHAASSSPPPPPAPSPAASPPPSLPPPATESTTSGWRTVGLVTGIVGLVGLGVGGVYGYMAKSKNDDAAAACPGNVCPDARGLALSDDAHHAATISTISVIAGGALVIGGVGLYLYAPRKEHRMRTALQITPQFGPLGLAISGTWR